MMRIITLETPLDLPAPVVTVGQCDGVHLGHVAVLEAVCAEAASRKGTGVVVTFDPHPRTVIDPTQAPGILTSLEEKVRRVAPLGIDLLVVVAFTQALRKLSPEAFVEDYLVRRLRAQVVVVGYDHGFGKGRRGGLETMQALGRDFGFGVRSVAPVLIDGKPVSSTRIRRLVVEGNLEAACRLLGGGYPVAGRVAHGDGRGRTLGVPTANLAIEEPGKLMPPDGVYAAWAYLPSGDRCDAVLNLGYRPTFNGRSRALEAHILDFEGDLYGQRLTLELVHRIRGEQRFETPAALIAQIKNDLEAARDVLSHVDTTLLRR